MCAVRWLIALAVVAGVCWLFPLFHVVPLKTADAEKAAATFNATQFAETFWTNQLPAAASKAVKAEALLPAIQADPAAAKKNFAHSVGLSEGYFYFVSGRGRVLAATDDEISLAVTEGGTNAEVTLQAGLVFGNALRDGTGLLNASDYPNSQDFNDISAALNHIVETRVLPKLHEQAKAGVTISFTGCAEVDDESADLKPLKVIPIQTGVQ
jgi:predicted lipoprotein